MSRSEFFPGGRVKLEMIQVLSLLDRQALNAAAFKESRVFLDILRDDSIKIGTLTDEIPCKINECWLIMLWF